MILYDKKKGKNTSQYPVANLYVRSFVLMTDVDLLDRINVEKRKEALFILIQQYSN